MAFSFNFPLCPIMDAREITHISATLGLNMGHARGKFIVWTDAFPENVRSFDDVEGALLYHDARLVLIQHDEQNPHAESL